MLSERRQADRRTGTWSFLRGMKRVELTPQPQGGKTMVIEWKALPHGMRITKRHLFPIAKFLVVVFLLFSPSIVQVAMGSAEEAEIVSSGERLLGLWQDTLSPGYQYVHKYKPDYYGVRKYKVVPSSFRYDIQRTNSLVSPYRLLISFSVEYSSNEKSPLANAGYYAGRQYGFKTAQQAEDNVTPGDFDETSTSTFDFSVNYVYQDGFWVYKGPNGGGFDLNVSPFLKKDENALKFERLLKVPVKTE
jgi:hypothetical protein